MITNLLNRLADIIVDRITKVIETLQGDRSDLEALACDRKCGKRRTPNEHCKNQLRYVGLETYMDELYASKKELSLCQTCASNSCPERDDKKETCEAYMAVDSSTDNQQAVEEKHITPHYCCMGCLANNGNCGHLINDTVADCIKVQNLIRKANIEAAESVKGVPLQITGMKVTALDDIGNKRISMSGVERPAIKYIDEFTEMGFTTKEASEIEWTIVNDSLIGTHSNHKPVKITENGVEFVETNPRRELIKKACEESIKPNREPTKRSLY